MVEDLELNDTNPYAGGYIEEYEDGTYSLERDVPDTYTPKPGDLFITVVHGMTLSDLAGEHYNDSQLWHVIANANPQLEDYFNLPDGMDLIIPSPSLLNLKDYE